LLNINRELNRFRDVLPCKYFIQILYELYFIYLDDDTRVRLTRGSNDYINANYVQIPSVNRQYILTQVCFLFVDFENLFLFGNIGTTSSNSKSFLANDLGTK
jgi:hypothetical protein